MAAPETLECWVNEGRDAQLFYIYEALGGEEDFDCFVRKSRDEQLWMIYNVLTPIVE